MGTVVKNVRSTVQVAVGASRHLLWFLNYQVDGEPRKRGSR